MRPGSAGSVYMLRAVRSPDVAAALFKAKPGGPMSDPPGHSAPSRATHYFRDGAFYDPWTAGTPERIRYAHYSFRLSACRRCQENVTPLRYIPCESIAAVDNRPTGGLA